MDNTVDHHMFNISDGTAIAAGALGHTAMPQFLVTASSTTLLFVENGSRACAVRDRIDVIY